MAKKRNFLVLVDKSTGSVVKYATEYMRKDTDRYEVRPNFDLINFGMRLIRVIYARSGGGIFVFEDSKGRRFDMHNFEFNDLLKTTGGVRFNGDFTFKKYNLEYTLRPLKHDEAPIDDKRIMEEYRNGKNFIDF